LQGKPGWYEEKLGAIPTKKTKTGLELLRQKLQAYPTVLQEIHAHRDDPEYFTMRNVAAICAALNINPSVVVGTTWTIDVNIVKSWPMPTVKEASSSLRTMQGGNWDYGPWSTAEPSVRTGYNTKINEST
jgi:hypothetical protein